MKKILGEGRKRGLLCAAVLVASGVALRPALGASIFANPITGTNPDTDNPYTTGQIVDPNITASGIGRGPGITATDTTDAYNASSWDTATIDTTAYYTWTLTPSATNAINFSSFAYTGQASGTGANLFAFSSSLDSFATTIGAPSAGGTTINLSAAAFQNVTVPIEFRLYGWGGGGSTGTFRINDFTFSGTVTPATVVPNNNYYWIGADATPGGSGIWDIATSSSWTASTSPVSPVIWDSTKTGTFGGTTPGVVTVNGPETASAGLAFTTNGYTVSPGALAKVTLTGTNAQANAIDADNGVTATFGVVLAGTAGMSKTGGGTLILTGSNSYTGDTTVYNGTLQIGNNTAVGSVLGNITTNGTTTFARSDTVTFSGNIGGGGILTQAGGGTLVLTGNATPTAGTVLTGGTLQLGNGGVTGAVVGPVTINPGTTLAFDRSDTFTFAGTIAGTGTVAQLGASTLILTSPNTYSGLTTIAPGGTVQVGGGSTGGTIFSDVSVAGALIFDRTTAVAFGGNISGTGTVSFISTGALTYTGNATHSGGTTIASVATLQVGSGGTSGSWSGAVSNAGALTFNRSDAATFGGSVSGNGSVIQKGSGVLTLTGSSSYQGQTTVQAGTIKATNNNALGAGIAEMAVGSLLANAGVTVSNPLQIDGSGAGTGGLLASWNFGNETTGLNGLLGTFNTTGSVEVYNAGSSTLSVASAGLHAGTASIDLSHLAGAMGGTANNNWGTFGGTTLNEVAADAAASALAVVGTGNNNSAIIFKLDTTGYHGLVATYATERTSSGATDQTWSYSTDGNAFNTFAGSDVNGIMTGYTLKTVNFSTITALDNAATVYLKVTYTGASIGTNGNNRIDNVQFNAVPLVGSLTPNAVVGSDSTSGTVVYSGAASLFSRMAVTAAAGGTVSFTGAISDLGLSYGLNKVGQGVVVLTNTSNTYSGGTIVDGGVLVFRFGTRPASDVLTIDDMTPGMPGAGVVITEDAGNILNYRAALALGTTIKTTTATATNGQAIGYMDGKTYLSFNPSGNFGGFVVGTTDMLLKYTYAGDANLDGKITVADYAQIDSAFLLGTSQAMRIWAHGDFNYDGVINYKDYALIDSAFLAQSGALADGEIDAHIAEFGAPYVAALNGAEAAAPEPGSLVLLALGAVVQGRRRVWRMCVPRRSRCTR